VPPEAEAEPGVEPARLGAQTGAGPDHPDGGGEDRAPHPVFLDRSGPPETHLSGPSGPFAVIGTQAAGNQYSPRIPMFSLATRGGILYAAGGGPGGRVFAYDPAQPKALWTAKFDGDTVYVAGHYDYIVPTGSTCYQVCPGGPTRHHLSAFNAADGAVTARNRTADFPRHPVWGMLEALLGHAG
jgi:hypothetical protein